MSATSTTYGTIGHNRSAGSTDNAFSEYQSIFVLDEEGTIQHISREARRLLDLDPETIAGRSFFAQVHPDHLNRVKWDLVQMIGRGKQRVTWLVRLRTGFGTWQWFKLEAVNRLGHRETGGIILWLYERVGRHHPGRQQGTMLR